MNTTVMDTRLPEATMKVLRNTYLLLSMTLLTSFATAMTAMQTNAEPMGWIGIIAIFGLLFAIMWLKDSVLALPLVFAFTGTFGWMTGPLVNMYLEMANGPDIVATALGGTAGIFLALSAYVLTTKKNFSFMGGFLFAGLLVIIGFMILNIFLAIPAMSLMISAAVIMIMSGYILYDTSKIIHGDEDNYVMATVGLYLNILNIFIHLLNILGIWGDD